jgi:uncharacterized membrane protein YbhN (UPF0104 family)/tRNA A-37 threonylcarbamoyl transferase component Bud32
LSPEASSRTSVFVDPDSSRSRRPLDGAAVVVGVLGLLVAAQWADAHGPLVSSLTELASSLPAWTRNLFRATYVLGTGYVIVVVILVLLTHRRRNRLLVTMAIAAVVAFVGAVLASLVVEDDWPDLSRGWTAEQAGAHEFPVVGVAVLTALLLAIRPWMVLSFQRLGVLLVGVLCLASWAAGSGTPSAVIGALAVGIGAAGVALLVVGSPGGHPDLAAVAASLRELGLRPERLHFAEVQPWTARVLYGTDADGERLLVKVYGRDAVAARRTTRWWRAIVYRDETVPGATRLQMVEHEALLTLLAERAGIAVPPVLAAAETRGDALIVLRAPPPAFAEQDDDELSDATLQQMWSAAALLHEERLCHGQLTLDQIGRADGEIVLSDFTLGSMASSRAELAHETATLLASQALRVGPERAVAAALTALEGGAVADARAYLQRPALPRRLRSSTGLKVALEGLQTEITERTGAPPIEPAPILRVQWRYLVMSCLVLLAAYALVAALGGLDWGVVLDSWRNASWGWILVGLVVAQGTTVADAGTTMSCVRTRLPLFPLVQLQYAIKFVGLAVSATAGRVGMNTAFLRKFGEGPNVAVAASALDSMAGAAVNVVVVVVALLLGGTQDGALTLDASGVTRTAIAVVGLALVCLVLAAVVPALRRRAVQLVRYAWSAFAIVAASPARMLGLFGSNLASLMITAVAMSCMVHGIHYSLPYWTVVAVCAGSGLISALIPVPGNVGVAEAAMTAGLGLVGIPEAPAFAIAVTQRIATTYLPSVFGVYSLRWLRAHDYA